MIPRKLVIRTDSYLQHDVEKDEYTHILKIKHNEAFKLMPVRSLEQC